MLNKQRCNNLDKTQNKKVPPSAQLEIIFHIYTFPYIMDDLATTDEHYEAINPPADDQEFTVLTAKL